MDQRVSLITLGVADLARARRFYEDVKVYRLVLSEQDRIGIGTFQPKDEKN